MDPMWKDVKHVFECMIKGCVRQETWSVTLVKERAFSIQCFLWRQKNGPFVCASPSEIQSPLRPIGDGLSEGGMMDMDETTHQEVNQERYMHEHGVCS
ncbi:Hypothetical protein FKW44_004508 [Caligus rogercresseyi]|uniref:Uncharacterized protein n=1 Tax=Caligus rogercresseyi TaxID=217165 RepID=A0A7T8HM16_CALRO|nr:Hypothetical protein FKW44_004508 [Caligus rogercresseyi]